MTQHVYAVTCRSSIYTGVKALRQACRRRNSVLVALTTGCFRMSYAKCD